MEIENVYSSDKCISVLKPLKFSKSTPDYVCLVIHVFTSIWGNGIYFTVYPFAAILFIGANWALESLSALHRGSTLDPIPCVEYSISFCLGPWLYCMTGWYSMKLSHGKPRLFTTPLDSSTDVWISVCSYWFISLSGSGRPGTSAKSFRAIGGSWRAVDIDLCIL